MTTGKLIPKSISAVLGSKSNIKPNSSSSTSSSSAHDPRTSSPIPALHPLQEDGDRSMTARLEPSLKESTIPSQAESSEIQEEQVQQDSFALRYQRALKTTDLTSSQPHLLPQDNTIKENETLRRKTSSDHHSQSSHSDSDFDWDQTDESELDENERQERKLRQEAAQGLQHPSSHHHIRRAKRLRKVYLFLMKLSRPVRTALLGFLGGAIAITPSILVLSKFTEPPARDHILVWSLWLSISFVASCITSIVVDILPALMIRLFNLFYGSTPEKLKTQVELWMNVRLWTKIALGLTWYWVGLMIILSRSFPFHSNPRLHYFDWVKKVTAGFFTAGIMLLVEKILLQTIQLNFHRTSLKDRLEENERALWALDQLAAAKGVSHVPKKRNSNFLSHLTSNRLSWTGRLTPNLHHHHSKRDEPEGRVSSSVVDHSAIVDIPLTPQQQLSPRNQLTPEPDGEGKVRGEKEKKKGRRTPNLLMVTDQLTAALAQATLKDKYRRAGERAGMGSTHSAKRLARKLFEGLDEDRGGVITRNEFEPYFKTAADAAMAFKLFDKDGNGDIDRKEIRNAVARIYRERSALATSLKDISSAVAKLDAVLIAVAFLITIFIWFFIFNAKGTAAQLVPMATIVLGFSFIFGNAAKNLFESMLFIFSIHPYDVGDMVKIDDNYMYVVEFGLFSTTFQRVDGQVLVAPNSILSSKKHIINIRRSGPMWETTELMVGFNTPLQVLHEFRARLRQFVSDNPREWKGGLDVHIDFISNQNLIQLLVVMEHKSNWQDWEARWERRTSLMKEMKRIMDDLNITYKLPIQPVSFVGRREANFMGMNGTILGGEECTTPTSRHLHAIPLPISRAASSSNFRPAPAPTVPRLSNPSRQHTPWNPNRLPCLPP